MYDGDFSCSCSSGDYLENIRRLEESRKFDVASIFEEMDKDLEWVLRDASDEEKKIVKANGIKHAFQIMDDIRFSKELRESAYVTEMETKRHEFRRRSERRRLF